MSVLIQMVVASIAVVTLEVVMPAIAPMALMIAVSMATCYPLIDQNVSVSNEVAIWRLLILVLL